MSYKVIIARCIVAMAMATGALLMFLNALGADLLPEVGPLKSWILSFALILCSFFMAYSICCDHKRHKEVKKGGGFGEK